MSRLRNMVALGLALGASIAWGGSDFLAGLVARRLPVLTVLILSQAAGLALLLCLLALAGDPVPPPGAVLAAAAAGIAEMIGFAALYRSLAIGPMSVVAPLASLAAVGPVVVGIAGGERPGPGTAVGGVAWTVAVNRGTSLAALALVTAIGRCGLTYGVGDLRAVAVVGLLVAGANALFALALTEGMISTVSVIGSLFPVTTVVLGSVLLRERPGWLPAAGIAGVLVGVGLVSAFGGA